MKKFISALLAFIMISSLTACGNGSSELPPSQSEPATQNQNAVPPDSTGIDSEEPTDDNQETANFLIVDSFIDSFNANSDDKITDIEEININDRVQIVGFQKCPGEIRAYRKFVHRNY